MGLIIQKCFCKADDGLLSDFHCDHLEGCKEISKKIGMTFAGHPVQSL